MPAHFTDAITRWLNPDRNRVALPHLSPMVRAVADEGTPRRIWHPYEIKSWAMDANQNYCLHHYVGGGTAYKTLPLSCEGCREFTLLMQVGSHWEAGKLVNWRFYLGASVDPDDLDLGVGPQPAGGGQIAVPQTLKQDGQSIFSTANVSVTDTPLGRLASALVWSFDFSSADGSGNIPMTLWVIGR